MDPDRLSRLLDQLPPVEMERPDEVRRELLRLAPVERRRPRRRRLAGLAIAAGLAAAALPLASVLEPSAPSHARITAIRGARFVTTCADPGEEFVDLAEGRVRFEVSKLHRGERFVVRASDGEVEVRGTSFEVDVVQGRLHEVLVHEGLVAVRSAGGEASIAAGQRWTTSYTQPRAEGGAASEVGRPETARVVRRPARADGEGQRAATRPVESAGRVAAPPRRRPAAALNARGAPVREHARPAASPEETAFGTGWDAVVASEPDHAADRLAKAQAGELAEDALFWRATSLVQGGRSDEARAAFALFRERFPTSERRGQAAVIAGWLELDAGLRREARRLFEMGVPDPSPEVRASAEAGLTAAGR